MRVECHDMGEDAAEREGLSRFAQSVDERVIPGDEAQLRKIILRLEQAHLPRYAQIRHGPLGHGKDIVAVMEVGGRRVLRMWQAKIGDINTAKWRGSRNEQEERYLVSLALMHIEHDVHNL